MNKKILYMGACNISRLHQAMITAVLGEKDSVISTLKKTLKKDTRVL